MTNLGLLIPVSEVESGSEHIRREGSGNIGWDIEWTPNITRCVPIYPLEGREGEGEMTDQEVEVEVGVLREDAGVGHLCVGHQDDVEVGHLCVGHQDDVEVGHQDDVEVGHREDVENPQRKNAEVGPVK